VKKFPEVWQVNNRFVRLPIGLDALHLPLAVKSSETMVISNIAQHKLIKLLGIVLNVQSFASYQAIKI
jgi:hypothetical protein